MNKRFKNWPRLIIQWGIVLVIIGFAVLPVFSGSFVPDFEAYCPFGGLQATGSYLLNQALSCSMTSTQIAMGLLLMIGVFLFSKLFCGYICPVGTISEWLGKLGNKIEVRITISGITDKIFRSFKYIILFVVFYFTLQSNELFCKKFDPYYAVVSGFNSDVVIALSVVSIALVIIGSVFIRLFWCKYICPLGALSNIFKFTVFFILIIGIYLIIRSLGYQLNYIWPLTILCVGGYVIEVANFQWKKFPRFRITRNSDSCINCQLCSRKCPQAIDVAKLEIVHDVDCNLCGECLSICPVENTIQINKSRRMRWIAPVVTLILIFTGLIVGKYWELPTIDQKWYGEDRMKHSKVFSMSGLDNVKCYGSSMAFASKMKKVRGVLGVATYVKHHGVKVYYDSAMITPEKIQEELFTPSKTSLKPLKLNVDSVQAYTFWLENFFDVYDFNYLTRLLVQETDAVGLISQFDCPVRVTLFFPDHMNVDTENLIHILEKESFTYKIKDKDVNLTLGYEVAKGPEYEVMDVDSFRKLLFKPFTAEFNKYSEYDQQILKHFISPLGKNKKQKSKLNYLVSHLSRNNGIVKFETALDSAKEVINITYVDSMVTTQEIFNALNADSLTFTYRTGKIGKMKNVFHFGVPEREEVISEK